MEAVLVKNDVLGLIKKPVGESKKKEALDWEKTDAKGKADKVLAIDASELKLVKRCKTSDEVWNKFSSIYVSKGPA